MTIDQHIGGTFSPGTVVSRYFRNSMFLFVPNVCNAQCYFCYTEPGLSGGARFTPKTLSQIGQLVAAGRELGFTEYRLTGGEPLIFSNFDALVGIFREQNVGYTILTNGVNLPEHLPCLLRNRPKKVTISYHSRENYEKIFGVAGRLGELERAVRVLLDERVDVCVTVLLLPENKDEIAGLVDHLQALGVSKFKFVYPNLAEIKMNYLADFEAVLGSVRVAPGTEFRYSDKSVSHCLLQERGFIALTLPDLTFYNCCTTVREGRPYRLKEIGVEGLSEVVMRVYEDAKELTAFPCKCHTTFCPISLTGKPAGR